MKLVQATNRGTALEDVWKQLRVTGCFFEAHKATFFRGPSVGYINHLFHALCGRIVTL